MTSPRAACRPRVLPSGAISNIPCFGEYSDSFAQPEVPADWRRSLQLDALLRVCRLATALGTVRFKVMHYVVFIVDALKLAAAHRLHFSAVEQETAFAQQAFMKPRILPNHVAPGADADSLESIGRLVVGRQELTDQFVPKPHVFAQHVFVVGPGVL